MKFLLTQRREHERSIAPYAQRQQAWCPGPTPFEFFMKHSRMSWVALYCAHRSFSTEKIHLN